MEREHQGMRSRAVGLVLLRVRRRCLCSALQRCVCVCARACVRVCVCEYICVCMTVFMYVCLDICIHVYTYIHKMLLQVAGKPR